MVCLCCVLLLDALGLLRRVVLVALVLHIRVMLATMVLLMALLLRVA